MNFKVINRNPGHWDIYAFNYSFDHRVAAIRGGGNQVELRAEKEPFKQNMTFPSVESCMSYICATLMKE
jgi:hypothetical protein